MAEQSGGQPNNISERQSQQIRPVERGSHPDNKDISHEELVGNIRRHLNEARTLHETHSSSPFDPVRWMSHDLMIKGFTEGVHNKNTSRNDRSVEHLVCAFDAISEPYLKPVKDDPIKYNEEVHKGVIGAAEKYGRHITLEPKAAKMLDAITEALDIPRPRGQTTIDLLQNIPQSEWPQPQQPEQQPEYEPPIAHREIPRWRRVINYIGHLVKSEKHSFGSQPPQQEKSAFDEFYDLLLADIKPEHPEEPSEPDNPPVEVPWRKGRFDLRA
jgi:hypothetical protein